MLKEDIKASIQHYKELMRMYKALNGDFSELIRWHEGALHAYKYVLLLIEGKN